MSIPVTNSTSRPNAEADYYGFKNDMQCQHEDGNANQQFNVLVEKYGDDDEGELHIDPSSIKRTYSYK